MQSKNDKICAVLVTFNRKELLMECMESLLRQTYPLDAIYLIDNASTDGTPQALMEKQYIKEILTPEDEPMESEHIVDALSDGNNKIKIHYVRMDKNTGGAGGFHEGIKRAYNKKYGWMWLMDDDTDPEKNSLGKLAKFFKRKDIAALAGVVSFHSGGIFYSTRGTIDLEKTYPIIQNPLSADAYNNRELIIDMASFVGVLVSAESVGKIGFPRKEMFIFHDDVEYCIRLRKAGKILLVTDSIIYHREPAREGMEKSFLGRKALRVPYERYWLTYFQRRNLVWLGKTYSTNKMNFYLGTLQSILRLISGVLRFDDNKIKRISMLIAAYIDGLRGNFDNEKPKKILYG
jgi:GT2 family glycosyltransferase